MASDVNTIVRGRQLAIRRELDRRQIPLKAVSFDSGIPYPTLISYFPQEGSREPAMLPASAIYSLFGAIPGDLLNQLVPEGWAIVRVPEGIDYDQIADWAEAFNAKKLAAHRADSECREQIGPNEKAELDSIVVAFPGKAA